MTRLRRLGRLAATAILALAILPACGDGDGGDPSATRSGGRPTLTIRATEYAYRLDTTSVPAGLVEVVLDNAGREDHEAQLTRVNDGVTPAAVKAALAKEFYAGVRDDTSMTTPAGGSHAAGPGERARTFNRLSAGTYLVYCLVAGPDGNPHTTRGMVSAFEVTEAAGAGASPPPTVGEITMDDYDYALPDGFNGNGTFKVVNRGERVHQFALTAPKTGRTVDDIRAYLERFEGEPPFTERAGLGALAPGSEAYLELELPPGEYLAICLLPVAGEETGHFAKGQQLAFTVR